MTKVFENEKLLGHFAFSGTSSVDVLAFYMKGPYKCVPYDKKRVVTFCVELCTVVEEPLSKCNLD